MRFAFCLFLSIIARVLFSLRYRIEVKGFDKLKKKKFLKNEGILFLPNHPALVDPIFVAMILWRKFKVRPLVVEYIYRQGGINLLMRLIKAIPVPNLDTSLNEVKIRKTQLVIDEIIAGLKKKQNFILYPAGRLKHGGKEIIGGASATHTILSSCPHVNVVLIRTSGLWGSSFSRAYTGRSPDFKKTLFEDFKHLLKSFVFFIPKRRVLIEIEIPKDFPRGANRIELNKYLENWYNQYPQDHTRVENEPLYKVSYSCFKEKYYAPHVNPKEKKAAKKQYSSKIEDMVYAELQRLQPDVQIKHDLNLASDLGLDSLDIAELITYLNVHFDVGEIHPEDIETVHDVLLIAEGKKIEKNRAPIQTYHYWPEEKNRLSPTFPLGKNIPISFLKIVDRMKNNVACGDDLLGVFTYKKLKLAILILASEIEKMEGKHIGVLLPASCVTYIIIFAILVAKKVPVMLNWTLGPRYLNHMVQLTQIKNVITSWKFLERLSNVQFGEMTSSIKYIEDIKKHISKKSMIKALFNSFKSSTSLINSLKLDQIDENDTAVILFTSGTEAAPKGVPLSHKNILSNLQEAMQGISLNSTDVLYGFLPPFHSFGFTVAGIFPLICGLKIAYSPDPTDSFTLAEGIHRWKITIFCTAPSFLKGILQAATKEQLQSMRLFVTGAEKAPKELFEKVHSLGKDKQLLEGYGITECSPILTLVRENKKPIGVGELLTNIEFCTVNPETKQKLKSPHEEGEICVRGPNIFNGYLGEQKDPFIMLDNKRWYCTGDLGYIDDKNNVILSGRLKRFAKIGGEMISLGGIEEIILNDLKNYENPIAVLSVEKEGGKSEIILFTTLDMNKSDFNLILKNAGLSRLVKISEVKKIDEIPLMASGKIDYRSLQNMIE